MALFGLTTRRWDLFKRLLQLGPMLCGLAVALPWYWLCYRANGWSFIQEFLINHNVARFATDRYQHVQPFWFFIPVVFVGFLPWVFQVLAPVWQWLRRQWREPKKDLQSALFWSWALTPNPVLFSVAIQTVGLRAASVSCSGFASGRENGTDFGVQASNEGAFARRALEPLSAGLLRSRSWSSLAFGRRALGQGNRRIPSAHEITSLRHGGWRDPDRLALETGRSVWNSFGWCSSGSALDH